MTVLDDRLTRLGRGPLPCGFLCVGDSAALADVGLEPPCEAVRNRTNLAWTVGRLAANREIASYTEVVTVVREQIRRDFVEAARRVGADACVVSSLSVELDVGDQETCSARATITGTALARFPVHHDEPAPLTVLPLRGRRRA